MVETRGFSLESGQQKKQTYNRWPVTSNNIYFIFSMKGPVQIFKIVVIFKNNVVYDTLWRVYF